MARIPQNTITHVPTMVRGGNTSAPMPNGGLGRAIEAGAAGMNTQIRREEELGARRVQEIGRKGQAILGAIDSAAKLAIAIDRANLERDDAWASKTVADFNNAMGSNSLGYKDESGVYHDGLLMTPFTPDDEEGKGGTSVQTAMNDAIVKYQKDNGLDKVSGSRKELLEPRMKDAIGRWMTKAQSVDAQKIEAYYTNVRKEKTESSVNTAMAFVLPDDSQMFDTASAVYASDAALSVIDSRFIVNYADWVKSPDRDPAKLEFVSPVAKAEYDREYVFALDKVNKSRVNALLKMAVDSEDPEVTSRLFGFLEDEESPIQFSTAEQQRDFSESLQKAKEQRVVVEAGRERKNYGVARTLTARIAIGMGGDEDEAMLDVTLSKLPPERVFEIEAFKKDFEEKLEYGKWDEFKLSAMETMTVDNQQQKLVEISKYIDAIPNTSVRAQARAEMSGGMTRSGSPARAGSRITDTTLSNYRRFGGLGKDPAGMLDNLSRLADEGTITPSQYVKQVDALRNEAEDTVDPVGLLSALKDAGLDVGDLFARDKEGNIRFAADGRPIEADPKARQRQRGFVSDQGVGFWHRKRDYELSEAVMLSAYELAREFNTQTRMGVKGRGTLQEYLQKNLVNSAVGKEWSDAQMKMKIDSLRQTLESQYQEALGGYYLELEQRGMTEGTETDE